MIRVLLLFLGLSFAAAPLAAQDAGGGASYVIGGIAVDTSAKTTYDARLAGYRIARAKAWPILWERLTGGSASSAPRLGDNVIEQMVAGIEIQGEKFSTTRYIATLGVVFDRARAAAHFDGTAGAVHSGPMLLLPIFSDGGTRTLYQARTPWVAAWARFSEGLSPIDYILASGSAGDNVLLTSYQTARGDRPLWRNILNRFGSTDVLIAEVRVVRDYPGGPVAATFIARHGPDATELGRFALRTSAENGLDAMLDAGVRQVDLIYSQALREGRLVSEPDLTAELEPILSLSPDIVSGGGFVTSGGTEAEVETPDAKALSEIEALLRSTPTVTGVSLTSLSLGGTSRLVIGHSGTIEMLRYQLDQKGLRLVTTPTGELLRRRRPTDPRVPAPVVVAPTDAVLPDAPPAPLPTQPAPTQPPAPSTPPAIVPVAPEVATPRGRQPKPAAAEPPAEGPVDLMPRAPPR